MHSLKNRIRNQRGLTLIELLVVIVIIGIIAAIAIPMVMSQQSTANENTNLQNQQILQDAVNRYHTMNDGYPADLETLTVDSDGGPYVQDIPEVKDCSTGFDLTDGTVSIPSTCPGGS